MDSKWFLNSCPLVQVSWLLHPYYLSNSPHIYTLPCSLWSSAMQSPASSFVFLQQYFVHLVHIPFLPLIFSPRTNYHLLFARNLLFLFWNCLFILSFLFLLFSPHTTITMTSLFCVCVCVWVGMHPHKCLFVCNINWCSKSWYLINTLIIMIISFLKRGEWIAECTNVCVSVWMRVCVCVRKSYKGWLRCWQ